MLDTMGKFVIDFYKATNMKVKVLNMGGGFAIKYLDEDAEINLEDMFKKMVTNLENIFEDNISERNITSQELSLPKVKKDLESIVLIFFTQKVVSLPDET